MCMRVLQRTEQSKHASSVMSVRSPGDSAAASALFRSLHGGLCGAIVRIGSTRSCTRGRGVRACTFSMRLRLDVAAVAASPSPSPRSLAWSPSSPFRRCCLTLGSVTENGVLGCCHVQIDAAARGGGEPPREVRDGNTRHLARPRQLPATSPSWSTPLRLAKLPLPSPRERP